MSTLTPELDAPARLPELFEAPPMDPLFVEGVPALAARDSGILELGRWLQALDYRFTTPTPDTHRRVNLRAACEEAMELRDVFGWSRRFRAGLLPAAAIRWLDEAAALGAEDGWFRSRLRFSTLDDLTLVHSAWPTLAPDSVFFGPDTYRFATLIRSALESCAEAPRSIVDIGCGTGAGGLLAARQLAPAQPRVVLADINPQALRLARINARLAGVPAECVLSDVLGSVPGEFDLVLANPPYLADPAARVYRDGGGHLGSGLSLRIVAEGLQQLAPDGRLVLYTGSAIVGGRDLLREGLEPLLQSAQVSWDYRELDPDVFGEELDQPAYRTVERIAAVGLIVTAPGAAT
ncbi:MAG TPA: class I SAM-dependent methyltransferase [Solimonas sp.]|nr:class I SAM-dependent methyltransferase [Solimonas sp.]